jgi:transcriptional regulator with XRE-family HTH domain
VNYKHNPEFCKAFGEHLRRVRLEKGYGMREFALVADIEYSQLSKIERGVTNPTISTVYSLAEALGINFQQLFSFEMPAKGKPRKKPA